MKHKRYTEEQIIGAIKAHEAGEKVADICRRPGIAESTFYNWRSKYGGKKSMKPNGSRSLRLRTAS